LARRGIIRCIITTNFDHYLEKALEEKGIEIQVISTDDDLIHSKPLIHCKEFRIYKPNGDLGKGALKNTSKDLEKFSTDMEEELIRVLSEHGVIVLGYSGQDKNFQEVFKKANFDRYPLFWVKPSPPKGVIEDILKSKNCTYIPCEGANQFITEYLRILKSLDNIAPDIKSGPTILELKQAFESTTGAAPLYNEFLEGKCIELKNILPDFTKFAEYDDAIVEQIEEGIPILQDFIESFLLASKYDDEKTIDQIYEFFGNLLNLYNEDNVDGYKFLVYEIFVLFIATLIKYDRWNYINILDEDLFVKDGHLHFRPYTDINRFVRSIDEDRNTRLNLKRLSIMADMLEERYTQTELASLINHQEFLEADYFLFIRSICHESSRWCPRSCLYLDKVPTYILKAESKRFLRKISNGTGISEESEFIEKLENKHRQFEQCFSSKGAWIDSPLEYFDFKRLGTRK